MCVPDQFFGASTAHDRSCCRQTQAVSDEAADVKLQAVTLELVNAKKQIAHLTARVVDLSNDNQALRMENASMRADIEKLQSKLFVESESSRRLVEANAHLVARMNRMEEDMNRLINENRNLQFRNRELERGSPNVKIEDEPHPQ